MRAGSTGFDAATALTFIGKRRIGLVQPSGSTGATISAPGNGPHVYGEIVWLVQP